MEEKKSIYDTMSKEQLAYETCKEEQKIKMLWAWMKNHDYNTNDKAVDIFCNYISPYCDWYEEKDTEYDIDNDVVIYKETSYYNCSTDLLIIDVISERVGRIENGTVLKGETYDDDYDDWEISSDIGYNYTLTYDDEYPYAEEDGKKAIIKLESEGYEVREHLQKLKKKIDREMKKKKTK